MDPFEGLGFDTDVNVTRFSQLGGKDEEAVVNMETMKASKMKAEEAFVDTIILITSALEKLNKDVERACTSK